MSNNKQLLASDHKAWLAIRNSCGTSRCVTKRYQQQIKLLSDLISPQKGPLLVVSKKPIMTRNSKVITQTDEIVFNQSGDPYYFKITALDITTQKFSTIYESKNEVSFIAHNEKYIALSDQHSYNSKNPIVLIDKNTGKKIAEKGLQSTFKWGKFEAGKLIGIQGKTAMTFDVPTLEIISLIGLFKGSNDYVRHVEEWDNLLIIQSNSRVEIYDKQLSKVRTIKLPMRAIKKETYSAICQPGEFTTYKSFLLININCGELMVYDLNSGSVVKKFLGVGSNVSYTVHQDNLWIFPKEASSGHNARILDFDSGQLISEFEMTSGVQVWYKDTLISLEMKSMTDPSIFTFYTFNDKEGGVKDQP
jgi:hypothetical protein